MNKVCITIAVGALLIGCGKSEEMQEAENAMKAIEAVTTSADEIQQGQDEAAKFQQERREKGDTVAMPYAELQKFLPSSIDGYSPAEEPSGSSQNMAGFSMSQAAQTFAGTAGADGNAPSIVVTIVDFGGTEAGYGMMALPMMMNMSQEDAHRRSGTIKSDVPYTSGLEDYNKDTKEAKVTYLTRYRYMITVEAKNQAEDQTAMVKTVAEDIAKKFDGK
jgi:hypothetical protein